MRELALRETPARLEVLGEALLLLHGSNDSSVNGLLIGGLGFGECSLLLRLALCEELLFRGSLALLRFLSEVCVVDLLVDLRIKNSESANAGVSVDVIACIP